MTREADTLIIGGGVSGLACAWWLGSWGIDSIVLERAERTGGLIDTTSRDGYVTDHAASMMLNFDAAVNDFIAASGLLEHKILRRPMRKRCVIKQGRLIEVPASIHGLMLSGLFSRKARLRLMTELFGPARPPRWESAADFIRRRLGPEILELAFDPYLSAVLACDPEKACARATLPRLSALEQKFGSFTAGILLRKLVPGNKGLPQEAFAFAGGMKTLVEALSQNASSDIRTGQRVTSVEFLNPGWSVGSRNNGVEQRFHARNLVLSTPADVSATLLRSQLPELARLLDRIDYAPIALIHLGYDIPAMGQSMQGSGFLAPGNDTSGIRGSLWTSNLIESRAPPGKFLTSNFVGGACQPGVVDKSDEALVALVLAALEKLCGLKASPEMIRINRHLQGLPLYHGRHAELTRAIHAATERHDGLHLAANFLGGISIRDRIIQGKKLAARIRAARAQQGSSRPIVGPLAFGESWSV